MELRFEYFDFKQNLAQQKDLFNDAFPEEVDPFYTENYLWYMHKFPNVDHQSFEYCAYIGNELVGYYAAIPYRYKIGNDCVDVGMVCGLMTSSKYRGKGIFTQLGKYATGELAHVVPFTTVFPIRKYSIPGHLKAGWKIAFELPLYMKFIKMDSLIHGKFKWASAFLPIMNTLLNVYNWIFKSRISKGYTLERYSNIMDIVGYENFTNKWRQEIPNALIKDIPFSNWRFGRLDGDYNFLVIRSIEQIVGFTAYRSVVKEGVLTYCLLDLMVLSDNIEGVSQIYRALTDEAKKNGVEAIMVMMSRYSARKYQIKRNAFLKSPYTFYFILKNLINKFSDQELFNEKNWHLMWIDTDDL